MRNEPFEQLKRRKQLESRFNKQKANNNNNNDVELSPSTMSKDTATTMASSELFFDMGRSPSTTNEDDFQLSDFHKSFNHVGQSDKPRRRSEAPKMSLGSALSQSEPDMNFDWDAMDQQTVCSFMDTKSVSGDLNDSNNSLSEFTKSFRDLNCDEPTKIGSSPTGTSGPSKPANTGPVSILRSSPRKKPSKQPPQKSFSMRETVPSTPASATRKGKKKEASTGDFHQSLPYGLDNSKTPLSQTTKKSPYGLLDNNKTPRSLAKQNAGLFDISPALSSSQKWGSFKELAKKKCSSATNSPRATKPLEFLSPKKGPIKRNKSADSVIEKAIQKELENQRGAHGESLGNLSAGSSGKTSKYKLVHNNTNKQTTPKSSTQPGGRKKVVIRRKSSDDADLRDAVARSVRELEQQRTSDDDDDNNKHEKPRSSSRSRRSFKAPSSTKDPLSLESFSDKANRRRSTTDLKKQFSKSVPRDMDFHFDQMKRGGKKRGGVRDCASTASRGRSTSGGTVPRDCASVPSRDRNSSSKSRGGVRDSVSTTSRGSRAAESTKFNSSESKMSAQRRHSTRSRSSTPGRSSSKGRNSTQGRSSSPDRRPSRSRNSRKSFTEGNRSNSRNNRISRRSFTEGNRKKSEASMKQARDESRKTLSKAFDGGTSENSLDMKDIFDDSGTVCTRTTQASSTSDVHTEVESMLKSLSDVRKGINTRDETDTSFNRLLEEPDSSGLDPITRILVQDLWAEEPKQVKKALTDLRRICHNSDLQEEKDKQIESLHKAGGAVVLIGVMRRWYKNLSVQVEACRTLHVAASGTADDFAESAVRSGAMETVLTAMKNFSKNELLQENACGALYSLTATRTNETSLKLAISLKGLPTIIQAMKTFPMSVRLQQRGCLAFCSMARWDELRSVLTDCMPVVELAMANHKDEGDHRTSSIHQRGGWAIERLSNHG